MFRNSISPVTVVSFERRATFRESLYVSTRCTVNSRGNFVTTWRGPESLVIEGARANRLARAHARDAGFSLSLPRRPDGARRPRKRPTSCCSSNRSESSRLLYQTHKSRLYCCYMLSRTNPRTGYDDGHGNTVRRKNNMSSYRWMRLLHTKVYCIIYSGCFCFFHFYSFSIIKLIFS